MAVTDREEKQLGVIKSLGTSWTSAGTVASGKRWNCNFNVCNLTSQVVTVTIVIADASWDGSGEPTGGELFVTLVKNAQIPVGDSVKIPGDIVEATQELALIASAADGVSVLVSGVEISVS